MININYIEKIILLLIGLLYYQKYGGSYFKIMPVTALMLLIIVISGYIALKGKTKIFFFKSYIFLVALFVLILSSMMWTNAINYGMSKVVYLLISFVFYYFVTPIIYKNFIFFLKINIFFYILYLLNLYLEYGSIADLVMQIA